MFLRNMETTYVTTSCKDPEVYNVDGPSRDN